MKKYLDYISYGFKTFILRKKIPYLFGMVITDKCNLNCFYCESKNSGKYHYDSSNALKHIKEAYKRGHRALAFTGGEPMLWQDNGYNLNKLVQYSRNTGFSDIFISTNGTVPLTIPCCGYIVSIDGPKVVHDKIRNNTYDLIIENVKNAVTKLIYASITLTRSNVQYLEECILEIFQLKIFKGILFNLLTQRPEIVEKYGISGKERTKLLDKIWNIKKQGYPIVLSKAAYLALRNNDWKRPISQIELATKDRIFTCCRDVDNPAVCRECGYVNCVEVSQMLALKPSAIMQVLGMVN